MLSLLLPYLIKQGGIMSGALGPNILQIVNSTGVEEIPVASQATVYTLAFSLSVGVVFGLAYRATSAGGAPDVKIEIEQSFQLPTTEEASDTNYVVPEGFSDIETNLTTELWKITTFSPIVMPYGRFKITGNAANPADTTVNIKVGKLEDI